MTTSKIKIAMDGTVETPDLVDLSPAVSALHAEVSDRLARIEASLVRILAALNRPVVIADPEGK